MSAPTVKACCPHCGGTSGLATDEAQVYTRFQTWGDEESECEYVRLAWSNRNPRCMDCGHKISRADARKTGTPLPGLAK